MPSIAEIARNADVSRCAASQILNKSRGYERFSPALQDRVLAIATQLGWAPDSRGLALQQGKTGVLALALPGLGRKTGLVQSLITAIERATRKHDQYLQIIGGSIESAVQAVHSNRCDGVMAIGWNLNPEECQQLLSCNHVTLCQVPQGLRGIALDLHAGLTRAVSHLHSLGHRRFLWLYADINGEHDLRWGICRQTAKSLGMDCERMSIPMPSDLGAEEADEVAIMRALIAAKIKEISKYTAVICYNELMAIALYAASAGVIRIPEDLSVIGIDDVHASLAVPPMSCVSFNLNKLADDAVLQLLRARGNKAVNKARVSREVNSSLSIRQSTARINSP